ncbi:MAG: NAD(P)-binding protein [Verrucomicrobia bacterium]|jgi:protoporphyrinogen oxidase|nr:NAD(P)-binding protein [Verrucomicrobiota bacterium]
MPTVVVGAGVTGLTVALQCLRAGQQVVVLERESVVGGLCRSYHYGDFSFDIGPHRLFSADPEIDEHFLSILGAEQVNVPRVSQVNLNGTYHDWPLGMKSIPRLSPRMLLGCLVDLLPHTHGEIVNLRDFVLDRYGKTIYRTFWEDYTEKFLGVPCTEVAAEWGALSVNRSVIDKGKRPGGLVELLYNTLCHKKSPLQFRYPLGGMGAYPEKLATMVRELGGEIRLDQEVTAIRKEQGRICELTTREGSHQVDNLVWTGSLVAACSLLNIPPPELDYLDIALLNLEVEGELGGDWQWVYFPDKRHIFSRISRPDAFLPAMTPAGMTGLCVEVTLPAGSPYQASDSALESRVYEDLVKVGLLRNASQIVGAHKEHVKDAYPIYTCGFRDGVDSTFSSLAPYKNLHMVGRMARFEHDNIDEAVGAALELAPNIQPPA